MRTGGPDVAPYVPVDALLVSPVTAARRLEVSRSTMYLLMARGDIPFRRIGNQRRIRVADLDAYVDGLFSDAQLDLPRNFNLVGGTS